MSNLWLELEILIHEAVMLRDEIAKLVADVAKVGHDLSTLRAKSLTLKGEPTL